MRKKEREREREREKEFEQKEKNGAGEMLKKKNILDKEEKTMTRNTEESAHFSFAF